MSNEWIPESSCAITRGLGLVGRRWTLLILREALAGSTRFNQFRDALGVPGDVLAERLGMLVDLGVMERRPYREPGRRSHDGYHLTAAGRELEVVVRGLQQWADRNLPWHSGPTATSRRRETGELLHVGFIDPQGHEVALADVTVESLNPLSRRPED